jgi:integrase
MPRPLKPWFHTRKNCWVIEPNGNLVKLADGPKNAETKKEAEKQFHLHMATLAANPPVDGDDPTVASVIDAFLVHDEKHSKPRTFAERKRYLQLFAEAHGRKLVSQCKKYHLTSWLDAHPEWANPWTRSYVVRCVKRPFNWAVDEDLLGRNPFGKVKAGQGSPRRPMTTEEYERLLGAARGHKMIHTVEALRFLYIIGCRPEIVRHLRWDHVRWDELMIVIDKPDDLTLLKIPKRVRFSMAHPEVQEMLRAIQQRQDHPKYVFVSRLRKPWSRNGIQQNVKRLRREVGLPEDVVVYGLRHSWATRGGKEGVSVKHIAVSMTHQLTATTEKHYMHLDDDDAILHQTMLAVNGLRPAP